MVAIAAPFHCSVELAVKAVPLTVNVNAALVATIEAGIRLVMTGGCGVTGKVTVLEVTAPMLTQTVILPAPSIWLAGTDAVSCVALTSFVVSGDAFHSTIAPELNPEPLTVSMNAAEYAVMDAGLSVVTAGGAVIVKASAGDEACPVVTRTLALPVPAIRLAGTDAVSCVALTYVVASGDAFHSACDDEMKPVPVSVRLKAGPVATAFAGLRVVRPGVGGLIGNAIDPDDAPAAITVMLALPAVAIRLAATDAVN